MKSKFALLLIFFPLAVSVYLFFRDGTLAPVCFFLPLTILVAFTFRKHARDAERLDISLDDYLFKFLPANHQPTKLSETAIGRRRVAAGIVGLLLSISAFSLATTEVQRRRGSLVLALGVPISLIGLISGVRLLSKKRS